jgi:hypothetical protein
VASLNTNHLEGAFMLKSMSSHLGIVALFAMGTAHGADFLVPQQFPTIQSAIEIAPDGSRIVVAPGTYRENLLIQRSLVLVSTGGSQRTTLDGQARGAVIAARGDGSQQVTIKGFTITNGLSTFEDLSTPGAGSGGGIHLMEVEADIDDNVVTGNVGCLGTGIAASSSTVRIVGNRITDNVQHPSCNGANGGGIFFNADAGKPSVISRNEIARHRIGGVGGGIYVAGITAVVISANVISDNVIEAEGGGGIMVNASNVEITNNIIRDNAGVYAGGVALFPDTTNRVKMTGNLLMNNRGGLGMGSAMYIQLFDLNSLVLDHNIVKANTPDALLSCGIQPFVIKRTNVLVNVGGPEIEGTCVR